MLNIFMYMEIIVWLVITLAPNILVIYYYPKNNDSLVNTEFVEDVLKNNNDTDRLNLVSQKKLKFIETTNKKPCNMITVDTSKMKFLQDCANGQRE